MFIVYILISLKELGKYKLRLFNKNIALGIRYKVRPAQCVNHQWPRYFDRAKVAQSIGF